MPARIELFIPVTIQPGAPSTSTRPPRLLPLDYLAQSHYLIIHKWLDQKKHDCCLFCRRCSYRQRGGSACKHKRLTSVLYLMLHVITMKTPISYPQKMPIIMQLRKIQPTNRASRDAGPPLAEFNLEKCLISL